MMYESKVKHRVRPMSAKHAASQYRQRTQSAKSHNLDPTEKSRRDLNKMDSSLLYRTGRNSTQAVCVDFQDDLLQKLKPRKVQQSKQSLYDENMQLRRQMNVLDVEMRGLKTKLEKNRRRSLKFTNKLEIQFEKELYYSGAQTGKYIVQGVKHQYERLKEEHQKLKKELEFLKKQPKHTDLQQKITQCQAYQNEAGRLREQLDRLVRIYSIPQNLFEANRDNIAAKDILVEDLKKDIRKYESDITAYESGIEQMNKMIRERDVKIQFLEKRLIEKDNHTFVVESTNKKIAQDLENAKNKLKSIHGEHEEIQQSLMKQITENKQLEQKRYEKEMVIFKKQLHEKQTYIGKLEKQVGYLSALVKELRPVEAQTTVEKPQPRKQTSAMSFSKRDNRPPEIITKVQEVPQSFSIVQKSIVLQQPAEKPKHYTMKRMKVKQQDIKDTCLQLKYRLISSNTPFHQAKQYISGDKISIKKLNQIFSEHPFQLQNQQRRILLCRYLIESSNDAYIYYDEELTEDVKVVQAIFQTAVPKYSIIREEDREKVRQRVVEMLKQYQKTLNQAVSHANKQFLIPIGKFVEILNQNELNIGQDATDYMIMEMLKDSDGVASLNYKKLQEMI